MEPNTEEIFSTQTIEYAFTGTRDDDEVPATDEKSDSESSSEECFYRAESEEFDMEAEQKALEREERLKLLMDDSVYTEGNFTQSILKRLRKTEYNYRPSPPTRTITQEEIDDNEMISRASVGYPRHDMGDMFYVNEKIPTAEDETLPEVKQLVLAEGFISALKVHTIISQSQALPSSSASVRRSEVEAIFDADDIETGVCTQLELQYNKKAQAKKSSAELHLDDFDHHPDPEILAEIDKQQLLNNSLSRLSQKLNNSQRAAEIIESSFSQSNRKDLDVSMTYLDEPQSDDDSYKCTEELEFDFLVGTEIDDSMCFPKFDEEVSSAVIGPQSSRDSKISSTKCKEADMRRMEAVFGEVASHDHSMIHQTTQEILSGKNVFPSFSKPTVPAALPGFSFVSGKNVEIKNFNRVKALFELEDQATVSRLQKEFDVPAPEAPKSLPATAKSLRQFKAPPSSSITVHDAMSTPKQVRSMENMIQFTPQSNQSPSFSPIMPSTSGFVTAGGKNSIAINTEKLKQIADQFKDEDDQLMMAQKLLDDVESPVKPPLKKLRLDFGQSPVASSPFMMDRFKKGIAQHSTPLVSRFRINADIPESRDDSSVAPLCSILEDESLLQDIEDTVQPMKKKFAKTCLINKFNDSADSDTNQIDFDEFLGEVDSIVMQHQTMYRVEADVKVERERALEEQKRSVTCKAENERAPMAGTVFMIKSSKNRTKVSEYVGQAQPKRLERHQITVSNAVDYKFTMQNHYDVVICRTNSAGITIADNARLIMNAQSRVGVDEIMWSFLASPGVEPKLVKERWIRNVYKMIVVKLSFLENSFEKFDKYELLNPENVLLQMKYRYDREIDKSHRSSIKKLAELDDVPCRRMVLKVVDIIDELSIGYELELSDGWYSVRTTIDAGLAGAVQSKKIVIGTKLVISCAELNGSDGCDPLQLTDHVRLRIHANSTRRTKWWAKLGFCKNPTQIQVPLDSILPNGGIIGKVIVAVIHVYPTVFVDLTGPTRVFRSKKLQHRIDNKRDDLWLEICEAVSHQVQQEEFQKLKRRVQELNALHKKVDDDDLSAEEICDLLTFETDEDELALIQKQLDVKMLERVQSVREERNFKLKERIAMKLGEKSKQPQPFIKIRVVDAVNLKATAIVTFWSQSEDNIDMNMLKEGKTIEILSSTAGPRTDEIQITAGKSSAIRIAKLKVPEQKIQTFYRKETKIAAINSSFKPPHSEFDLACVVFQVDPFNDNDKDCQKVFVSDEDMNVLCINFWNGIKAAAFDDVICVGEVVYARNLQWRLARAADDKPPKAFVVDDITQFISRPLNQSHMHRLDELRSSVGDIRVFVTKCVEKLSKLSHSSTTNKENRSGNISIHNVTADPVKSSLPVNLSVVNETTSTLPSTPTVSRMDSISRALAKRKRRLGLLSANESSPKEF